MAAEQLKPVKWVDLCVGDVVYILALNPPVCGPFTIESIDRRLLKNRGGHFFMHYPDDLYKENK